MKLIVAILVALGLGWLIDAFRRKSVSAPGVESGSTQASSKPLSDRIADTADAAMGAVAGVGVKAADTAQRTAPGAANAVTSAAETAAAKASDVAATAAGKASGVASTAADKASNIASTAAGTLSGAAASAADKLPEPVVNAASKAADTAANAAQAAAGAASGAVTAAANRLPGGASAPTSGEASRSGGGTQGSAGTAGQAQATTGGMNRAGATSGQGASDLTSAQEAFGEPLPATPPAGERPMEAPLRPDEADVRTALAEPTPEAVEVFDEDRDAIMLRSPQADTAAGGSVGSAGPSGGQASGQERGQTATGQAGQAQQGSGTGGGSQASASSTSGSGAPPAPSSGVLNAARTGGGPSEETRFRDAAQTGIDVESREAPGQQGGMAAQPRGQATATAGQSGTGGATVGQSGTGGATSQAGAGGGSTAAMAGVGAAGSATAGRMSAGGAGSGTATAAPADSVPGDGGYDCPTGYPVKGNAASHIYHQPGTRSYEQTKPEFCFKTVAAAEAAGYRISKQTLEAAGRPDLDVSEGLTGIGQSPGAAGTKSVPADGPGVTAGPATAGHAAAGSATQRSGANGGGASHGGSGGAQAPRAPAGAVAGDGTHRCPNGYPVKGNASSRIYHVPGSSSYEQTIPEFCFESSASAEAAGFRAPKR